MTDFENAIEKMKKLFSRDCQFALSTCDRLQNELYRKDY